MSIFNPVNCSNIPFERVLLHFCLESYFIGRYTVIKNGGPETRKTSNLKSGVNSLIEVYVYGPAHVISLAFSSDIYSQFKQCVVNF